MTSTRDRGHAAIETSRAVERYARAPKKDPVVHERLRDRVATDYGADAARYFDEVGELPYVTATQFPTLVRLPWPMRRVSATLYEALRLLLTISVTFMVGSWMLPLIESYGVFAVLLGPAAGVAAFAAATLAPRLLPGPKDLDQRLAAAQHFEAIQHAGTDAARREAARRRATRAAAASPSDSAAGDRLAALSAAIDAHNVARDPEAILWGRVAKVAEEAGEAVGALVGVTGQNPRKGVSRSQTDLVDELLDVATAALGAVEHLTENRGYSLRLLAAKIARVHERSLSVPLAPAEHADDQRASFAELTPVTYVGGDEQIAARFAEHSGAQGRGNARSTLVIFDGGIDYLAVPTEHLRAA